MKAVIKTDFSMVFLDGVEWMDLGEYCDDDSVFRFFEGDEVEVLKIIEDKSYNSGMAFVIFNPLNNASVTIDICWIRLLKDENQ